MATFAAANARFNFSESFSSTTISRKNNPPPIPIFISTDPSAVDLRRLSCLYSSCNCSSHRFPDPSEPADLRKLGVAIAHSSVVVSVFSREFDDGDGGGGVGAKGEGFMGRMWPPLSPENGRLVGFGRAVSDLGLTASIYDVMVLPGLMRMGIGGLIVGRILRMLTNRGVYDISALCSEKERQLASILLLISIPKLLE